MFETILGWEFGAVAIAVGLATAFGAGNLLRINSPRGRNVAIDGLRGYLAFGVFLHHATVWYFYARTGEWGLPPASIYRNLAAVCVSLFFMITAYLFVGKLLDNRRRPIDWVALYTSRLLRLSPLYLVAMAALFGMVGARSGWQLREPVSELISNVGNWLGFSLFGAPDINGVHPTAVLIAVVTWSLAYEWMFYLSLPALACLLRAKVPVFLAIACTLGLVLVVLNKPSVIFPSSFVKGAIAAAIARQPRIASRLCHPAFGAVVLVAAWAAMSGQLPGPVSAVLVAAGFCIVACGNTVFGVLSNRAAIVLGDVSYGVYLLHGLLLSVTFLFIIGMDRTRNMSFSMHWLVVMGVGVAVVTTSALTYRFIEVSATHRVHHVSGWIRARFITRVPPQPFDSTRT
jgi:peptidoglycan/LPS O-acetylase OafA/YrhL